jgi:hypothetical protein
MESRARGAQAGNNNATKNKHWQEALHYALANYADDAVQRGFALKSIALTTVRRAILGDHDAMIEIANRLDGKPKQQIEGPGEAGEHLLEIVHRSE